MRDTGRAALPTIYDKLDPRSETPDGQTHPSFENLSTSLSSPPGASGSNNYSSYQTHSGQQNGKQEPSYRFQNFVDSPTSPHHPDKHNINGALNVYTDQHLRNDPHFPAVTITAPPVSVMPVELLREIFRYTPPTAYRDIVDLAAVNSFWRGVALSVSELYTHANWDDWPLDALIEWARRSKRVGLHVVLGQQAVRRALYSLDSSHAFAKPTADEAIIQDGIPINIEELGAHGYIRLLDVTSPLWHTLLMEFDRGEDVTVYRLLPRWQCPQLRSLELIDMDDEGQYDAFITHPNMAPDLEELICKDVHIVRAEPWMHLKRVILNVDFWSQGDDRAKIFETVSQTEMLKLDGCGFTGVGGGSFSLNGVKEVTIVDDSVTGFAEWPLRHIAFPKASKLTLRGTRPYPIEFPDAAKVLWNDAFPDICELTLQLWKPWIAVMLPLLSRDTHNDYTLFFPKLVSLNLIAYDGHDHYHEDSADTATQRLVSRRMPREQIENAVLQFLGESTMSKHRDARPIQKLYITGIPISPHVEERLRALVEHIEIHPEITP